MAEQGRIRQAVAERRGEGNGQPGKAVAKPDAAWLVLEKMEPEIAKVLPDYIPVKSWLRTVLTGLRNSEALAELAATPSGRKSLYAALLECARFGLMPFTDEAALIPFGGKHPTVAFVPQYKGLIKGMLNTGQVEAVEARLIHRHDDWELSYGDNGGFYHKPYLRDQYGDPVSAKDRGEPVFAYCYVRLRGGGRSAVVILSRQEAEYIRDTFSRSYAATEKLIREYEAKGWSTAKLIEGSVWHRDFDAKWVISAIRRVKDVPRSAQLTELLLAAARDDTSQPEGAAPPRLSDFGVDEDIVEGEIVGEGEVAVRGPESHAKPPASQGDATTQAADARERRRRMGQAQAIFSKAGLGGNENQQRRREVAHVLLFHGQPGREVAALEDLPTEEVIRLAALLANIDKTTPPDAALGAELAAEVDRLEGAGAR